MISYTTGLTYYTQRAHLRVHARNSVRSAMRVETRTEIRCGIVCEEPRKIHTGHGFHFTPLFFIGLLTLTIATRLADHAVVGRVGDALGHTNAMEALRGRRRARRLAT